VQIAIRGPLNCHIWLGATTLRGYPVAKRYGRLVQMRRAIYEERKRPLADNEIVVMDCGERRCINPSHMLARRRGSQ
jgi:hypothetical protein